MSAKIIKMSPDSDNSKSKFPKSAQKLFKLAEVKDYKVLAISDNMRSCLSNILKDFNEKKQFNDEVEANTLLGALHHCIRSIIMAFQKVFPEDKITPDDILSIVKDHWNQCYCTEWSSQLFYSVCQSFRKAE